MSLTLGRNLIYLNEKKLSLGAIGNHNKDKGNALLGDYKNSCSFLIGSAELADETRWTDMPSGEGRRFSYFFCFDFGFGSCIQLLINEESYFFYRNYNGGSKSWGAWKKITGANV